MTELVKFCWTLVVFGLLQLSSGTYADFGINTNRELQVIKSTIKPQDFNRLMCIKGPSFWCQNISIAVGCKAVNYCTETIWKSQKYSNYSNEICDICTMIITDAKKEILINKGIKELLEAYLKTVCNFFPYEDIKTICKQSADEFISNIFILLEATNPKLVCTLIDVCIK